MTLMIELAISTDTRREFYYYRAPSKFSLLLLLRRRFRSPFAAGCALYPGFLLVQRAVLRCATALLCLSGPLVSSLVCLHALAASDVACHAHGVRGNAFCFMADLCSRCSCWISTNEPDIMPDMCESPPEPAGQCAKQTSGQRLAVLAV